MIREKLRRQRIQLQNGFCADCGRFLGQLLEMHHLTYEPPDYRLDQSWSIRENWETIDDILGLCRECHLGRHVSSRWGFIKDPDEKAALDS